MGIEATLVTRFSSTILHLSLLLLRLYSSVFPFLVSPNMFRLPSVPQPNPALGTPRGGSSTLLPAHLPGEWQRPRYQLQGVSEPDLCGGKDPPTRGKVWGLQWSYGRFPEEFVCPGVTRTQSVYTVWCMQHTHGKILEQYPLLKGCFTQMRKMFSHRPLVVFSCIWSDFICLDSQIRVSEVSTSILFQMT